MDGKRIIGIDIGKRWLDLAREDAAEVEQHANEAATIAALVGTFDPARDIVVFERCGGYERELEVALATANVPWAVVHSLCVKAFRQVQGIKAKTDAMDSRLLQGFGRDRLNAGRLRLGRAADVVLDALMARHRQLKAALHAEQCRRETAAIAPVRASIEGMIAQLKAALAVIAAELAAHEAQDPQLAFKEKVMCERKGVAQATARALLAELPEIGKLERREIASLGGIAPRTHKSGRTDRRRGLAPGRSCVKVILFNPARAAMRWDPEIRAFCNRLRARGKPGKVIMVAVMRKLLCGSTPPSAMLSIKRRCEVRPRSRQLDPSITAADLRRRAQVVKAGRRPPPKAARSGLDRQHDAAQSSAPLTACDPAMSNGARDTRCDRCSPSSKPHGAGWPEEAPAYPRRRPSRPSSTRATASGRTPYRTNGQYQTAGTIEKDGPEGVKAHQFVRADTHPNRDDAIAFAISKAKQIIDLQGDRIFQETNHG